MSTKNKLFIETWEGNFINVLQIAEVNYDLKFSYQQEQQAKAEGRVLDLEKDETEAGEVNAVLVSGKKVTLFYSFDQWEEGTEGKLKRDSDAECRAFMRQLLEDELDLAGAFLSTLRWIAEVAEGR